MSNERYCQHCAEPIDPSMAFCPNCGGGIIWRSEPKPNTWPTKPPASDTEAAELERKKAEALASLKADWWKTLIAVLVILYFVFHWIG